MNRTLLLSSLLLPLALCGRAAVAGDPPPPPPPPAAPPAVGPAAPAPGPAADDPFALGERCVDEAARWIAKGEAPPQRLETMHADLDYAYDDGSTHDERRMELWFRNPDAFRANTEYAGRDSTLQLVGDRGYLIRDRIRITPLNESPTFKELMPMMRNYRDILREVGRLMAPAGLKVPGSRFRLDGTVPNQGASGGAWFKVVRTAPREPMMTFFFGSAPRRDGTGTRAIAPDRLIIHGDPGTNYQGDEYRLEEWVHEGAAARSETMRYPKRIRLYAIGIDPENKPTMRATVNFLEVNQYIDPQLLADPFK